MIDGINVRFQNYRAVAFRPLLQALTKLRITANMVTNFRLILGAVFLMWFDVNRIQAAIVMLTALILDMIDGALARNHGQMSDRGKFLDVLVDHCNYMFVVLTFLKLGVNPYLVGFNIFIIPVAYLLATIKKEEFKTSDWIIKVYPRLSILKVPVVAFFIYIFINAQVLNETLLASNILALCLSVYYYIFIQRRWAMVYSVKR